MNWFENTYKFPFNSTIPSYVDQFVIEGPSIKKFIKFHKRKFYLFLKKQNSLEVRQISSKHSKILWINVSAPSLGDSLMDLSSRILLQNKEIDLYTSEKNQFLYKNDGYFRNVYTNVSEVKTKYDLIILDSYSIRSIRIKYKIDQKAEYISMFGYFNGPEVNRVLFSFNRMAEIIKYKGDVNKINEIAKCSLDLSEEDKLFVSRISLPESYIVIAVGGEWEYRTYKDWENVILSITKLNPDESIVIVGSKNATEDAKKILRACGSTKIVDYVNKLSFMQTIGVIRKAKILICCDGGLMHGSNAVGQSVIPLFARLSPDMQLTKSIKSFPLFDRSDVNKIHFSKIIKKYQEFLAS